MNIDSSVQNIWSLILNTSNNLRVNKTSSVTCGLCIASGMCVNQRSSSSHYYSNRHDFVLTVNTYNFLFVSLGGSMTVHLILSKLLLTWQRFIHLVVFAYILLRRSMKRRKGLINLPIALVAVPAKGEQFTTYLSERGGGLSQRAFIWGMKVLLLFSP